MAERGEVRFYNANLGDFEWRKVPASDDEALTLLAGSPHTPVCTETYREWRSLGASGSRSDRIKALRWTNYPAGDEEEEEEDTGDEAPSFVPEDEDYADFTFDFREGFADPEEQ